MFQAVEPKEIFGRTFWDVSEEQPAYWLAQLRRQEWFRLMLLLSLKPARRATKLVLAEKVLEKLEFQVCASWLEAYRVLRSTPGSLLIQYRHSSMNWTRGIPEIMLPDKADRIGVANIAGRLVCRPRK